MYPPIFGRLTSLASTNTKFGGDTNVSSDAEVLSGDIVVGGCVGGRIAVVGIGVVVGVLVVRCAEVVIGGAVVGRVVFGAGVVVGADVVVPSGHRLGSETFSPVGHITLIVGRSSDMHPELINTNKIAQMIITPFLKTYASTDD